MGAANSIREASNPENRLKLGQGRAIGRSHAEARSRGGSLVNQPRLETIAFPCSWQNAHPSASSAAPRAYSFFVKRCALAQAPRSLAPASRIQVGMREGGGERLGFRAAEFSFLPNEGDFGA